MKKIKSQKKGLEKEFFFQVNDFLEFKRLEEKSETTVETYRVGLNEFRKYLEKKLNKKAWEITFNDISADLIRVYLKDIIQSGKSQNTRNHRLTAVKVYMAYCADKDEELLPLQISVQKVKSKVVHPKKNNWLSKEQIELLLEQPAHNKIGVRDHLILLVLYTTGVRLSELTGMKVKDVVLKPKDSFIRVLGKGKKARVIPLPTETANNLRYYIQRFHTHSESSEPLFYTLHNNEKFEMSSDNVERIVKKYGDQARKKDPSFPNVHPHKLRHSYGALLNRQGMSPSEIALLMGHERIQTTEIYAETDVDMIDRALLNDGKPPKDPFEDLTEEERLKVMGLTK